MRAAAAAAAARTHGARGTDRQTAGNGRQSPQIVTRDIRSLCPPLLHDELENQVENNGSICVCDSVPFPLSANGDDEPSSPFT